MDIRPRSESEEAEQLAAALAASLEELTLHPVQAAGPLPPVSRTPTAPPTRSRKAGPAGLLTRRPGPVPLRRPCGCEPNAPPARRWLQFGSLVKRAGGQQLKGFGAERGFGATASPYCGCCSAAGAATRSSHPERCARQGLRCLEHALFFSGCHRCSWWTPVLVEVGPLLAEPAVRSRP